MHNLQAYENEYKETKEQDYEDDARMESFTNLREMRNAYTGEQPSLVDVWASSIRSSIHNPVPRNEWGKSITAKPFAWMLVEGLWMKNHDFEEVEEVDDDDYQHNDYQHNDYQQNDYQQTA
jgi:hypothetical protein